MKSGDVDRSPNIHLMAEENPGKFSARRSSDEGCATKQRLKWGPLSPNDVGGFIQGVGEGEEKKEEKVKDRISQITNLLFMEPWAAVKKALN